MKPVIPLLLFLLLLTMIKIVQLLLIIVCLCIFYRALLGMAQFNYFFFKGRILSIFLNI